ncbi:hypothetical protein QRX50_13615 [Amycolatopsis carbonis]|uniref:Uncharacterized protein n=1 Tax=Amycolatopsis carbonis TaxID=715471 RepID=A0A9Y2N085_9PSEU|nr:hypothetical protein [Amycolatopsis sp. 2-15]WIX81717.1 hypothetical protein QRX50_13615 [Amycolatopsis sp. 2-15]
MAATFPAVVHAPHYEVLVCDRRGFPEQTNQRLYLSREDAQWAMDRHAVLPGEVGARVVEYELAFYARCLVCGEFPDGENFIYPDWPGLAQCIAASPGWSCTSEQLVFCPHHAPDKEN